MIVSVGITGYSGRMGQAVAHIVSSRAEACLVGGVALKETLGANKQENALFLTDDPSELFPKCDVIIDFSHASVTPVFARLAAEAKKAFLSGTTGLDEDAMAVLRESGEKIPVLHAGNMSLSLAVAKKVAAQAASLLKDLGYDASVLDRHHKWKKDAPSGTALTLGKAVSDASEGKMAPSYASVRAGNIVGEHEVLFAGEGESIAIRHAVTDRRVFAAGAVEAALWLARQKAGFYGMDDALGL